MITLKLKLKEQEIELTMDEAKALYDELSVVFSNNQYKSPFWYEKIETPIYGPATS